MTEISLTNCHRPLDKTLRSEIARLLALAFAEDKAMIQMLGMARWKHIAYQYFHLQLSHPDCVVTARQADRLVGVLLASSPDNQPPFFASLREMLGMRWLLGSVFSESQRIAQSISSALPHAPFWYINQLAIDPALQHQRIGSGLLARLAQMTGTGPVYVDCESVLEGFYSGAGFKVSCRPRAIDLIVMAKNA